MEGGPIKAEYDKSMVRHEDKGLLSRLALDVYYCSQFSVRTWITDLPTHNKQDNDGSNDGGDSSGGGEEASR